MDLLGILLLVGTAIVQADMDGEGDLSSIKRADTKTRNVDKPDCFVNIRRRTKHHKETLQCEVMDDPNPMEQNLTCKAIIDTKTRISCCDLKNLCNREGYCNKGIMECFGHRGQYSRCVCLPGFKSKRCNKEVTNVTIPCDCPADVNITDNCNDVHFRETEQCWTTFTNLNKDACLCNNKKVMDLTNHPEIPNCNEVYVLEADIGTLTNAAINGSGIFLNLICATLSIAFYIYRNIA